MSTKDCPDEGDMQLALYAVRGIFTVMDWIDSGRLDEITSKAQLRDLRHNLALAGKMVTVDITNRF
jgi:hypothetical protein